MGKILNRISVATYLGLIFLTNSGLAFSQSIAAPKVNKRIAGHGILKVLNVLEAPDLNIPKFIFQDSSGLDYIVREQQISIFNEKDNRWTIYNRDQLNLLNYSRIRSIGESPDKKVWILVSDHSQYLSFYNKERWEVLEEYAMPIGRVFPSLTKGIWMFNQGELHHFDGAKWSGPVGNPKKLLKYELMGSDTGLQDSKGFIWLAGDGIHRYNPVKNEWVTFSILDRPDYIDRIYEDSTGDLWFINLQGQIAFYERKLGLWKTFELSDRIPNSYNIGGIVEDNQGQILFATNKGLVSFNKKYNQWYRSTSKNSGLLHSWVTCMYKDPLNRIWLGTPKGVMVLEP